MKKLKKRILVVAPACLPITGAEAIVNAKLIKALSIDGRFDIDLITKVVKSGPYPSMSNNEKIEISLHRKAQIEVDNKVNLKTILGHLKSFVLFGIASKGSHWAAKALHVAQAWIKNEQYDYILSKNFPALLICSYIKKRTNIKWVASWNDPFPEIKYPAPYGQGADTRLRLMDRRLIKKMKEADFHLFPCERLRDYMLCYLKIPIEKTLVIPHVAFPDNTVEGFLSDNLSLLHSGNLGHPRTPEYLFKALRIFLDDTPEARINLTIQGKIESSDVEMIKKLNLEKYITIIPPVSYSESIRNLSKYQVAVIIEAPCEEGIFLPTKVADYMEIKMPIFALSPQNGTLHDLFVRQAISYFAETSNVIAISQEIKRIFEDFQQKKLKPSHCPKSYLHNHVAEQYYSQI